MASTGDLNMADKTQTMSDKLVENPPVSVDTVQNKKGKMPPPHYLDVSEPEASSLKTPPPAKGREQKSRKKYSSRRRSPYRRDTSTSDSYSSDRY